MKQLSIEEKARCYDEAIKRAQEAVDDGMVSQNFVDDIFPELKDEDEKIREEMLEYCHKRMNNEFPSITIHQVKRWAAWLEKQGEQEQLYIRFGEIPTDEKSKIYQGEIEVGTENGVSVYPAFKTDEGDIVLGLNLPITKTTLYTQQHLIEYDDRPCYLVKGDYVGKDTDGQPLINNVSIIEKIDGYRVKEKKQGEQKPVWSEEDNETFDRIISNYRHFCNELSFKEGLTEVEKEVISNVDKEDVNWLKSLKDRV